MSGIVISTSVGTIGLPFKRSFVNISTSPPLATDVSGSSFATIVGGGVPVTVILTTAVSQTPGFVLSQILYLTVYVPGVALAGTLSLPVDGSGSSPVKPPLSGIVISTSVGTTGLPFKRSLLNISTVPPLATDVSGSSFATIVGGGVPVTVILTTAVSQTPGFVLSQILYVTVYVPGVALAGTLSLPVDGSGSSPVKPPLSGIVISTSVGTTGLPFKRSLLNISTVPPLATDVSGSSFATIVGVTLTFTVAVLEQAAGIFLSQIR